MFRLKISLTHAILVCALVGAAHLLINGHITGEVEQREESSLRRAAAIAEQSKRLDHFALMEKGRMVAQDLETYEFLTFGRDKLLEKINDENAGILTSDVGKKLGKKEKKEVETGGGEQLSTSDLRHLAVDFRLRVAKHRFENIAKDVDKKSRNLDRDLLSRSPVRPDMVMALNKNGTAAAALGRDRYHWGSSSYSPDVSKKHPVIQKVLDNPDSAPKLDVWRWSWGPGDDENLYQVAIVPIRPSKETAPAGVIVVGYDIHDGSAEEIQSLVGGVTTDEGASQKHVGQEAVESAPEIAFFHGDSIESSTLDSKRNSELTKAFFEDIKIQERGKPAPEKRVDLELNDSSYISFVRFLPGEVDSENPTGVAVMSNLSEAKAPAQKVLSRFNMIGLAAGVLGIVLMLFFYYQFIKPAGRIEETIGEILSGKEDAEFFVDRDDEIFSSLAQGLNLMSAYLRGEPMPDDEAELEGWDDMMGGGGPDSGGGSDQGGSGGGSPDVQGVQMPGMGPGGDDSSDKDGS